MVERQLVVGGDGEQPHVVVAVVDEGEEVGRVGVEGGGVAAERGVHGQGGVEQLVAVDDAAALGPGNVLPHST